MTDLEAGLLEFTEEFEDIHMNLEHLLTERIGAVGGKLHTARSRNDQVATDIRLYVRTKTHTLRGLIHDFQRVLIDMAEANIDVIMPGYTHLQVAQR